MNPAEVSYRRLPGRAFGVFQTHALWMTDDHLLLVQGSPVGEVYRRFYFRDIAAVVQRRTSSRLVINLAAMLLCGVSLVPWAMTLSVESLRDFHLWEAAFVGIFVGVALVNTLRGPTCAVHIQTAVQFERVGSLSRVRSAQRVLTMLRPLILAAQVASSTAPEASAGSVSETSTESAP